MKIKMSNVLALQTLYDKVKDQVMPISLAYKWSRLFKTLQEASDFYYTELNKIVNLYGEKDEEGNLVPTESGNGIKIRPESLQEAQIKINELSMLETDVSDDLKFSLTELDNLTLSLDEFNQLLPIIEQ